MARTALGGMVRRGERCDLYPDRAFRAAGRAQLDQDFDFRRQYRNCVLYRSFPEALSEKQSEYGGIGGSDCGIAAGCSRMKDVNRGAGDGNRTHIIRMGT